MIKVVIVEDDPMVAKINKSYIGRFKEMQVEQIFSHGSEALEYILKYQPHLVLLDISIPGINGARMIHQMRASDVKSDVIVITASNDVTHIEEMLSMGIVDYLIKPFEYRRFEDAVGKFLKKNQALSSNKKFSQQELDTIMAPDTGSAAILLPKGLSRVTLDMVTALLKEMRGTYLTCDEVARRTGLSRVTARRYLNYLMQIDFITGKVDYKTGGRPSITYGISL